MKKTIKTFLLIILSMIMYFTSIPAYAAETENQATPRLSHMAEASFAFDATSSGGYIDCRYTGYEASFIHAKLTVKVEKRSLLVFWNEVGTWTSASMDLDGSFYHVMALNGSGTYRATFTLQVTGVDMTVDVVDMVIESSY